MRLRDERGQTTAEYALAMGAAILALPALLIVGVLLAAALADGATAVDENPPPREWVVAVDPGDGTPVCWAETQEARDQCAYELFGVPLPEVTP